MRKIAVTNFGTEEKKCTHCGSSFMPKRSDAIYCSTKCRVYAYRKKIKDSEEMARFMRSQKNQYERYRHWWEDK